MKLKDIKDKVIYSGKYMNARYSTWYKNNKATEKELELQRYTCFDYSPLISIVVPVYNPKPEHISAMVKSVLAQSYTNWQLCLINGSCENREIDILLQKMKKSDERISVGRLKENRGISGNTNAGLKLAEGEWIAFADQDDLIEPNALYEYVKAINADPEIDALYSDEDKIDDKSGRHFMPHFKSDFNLDLLLCINYVCHMFMVRKSISDKVGAFRSECDGSQDHDYILRCSRECRKIHHVSKILYSWRSHVASTAKATEAKTYQIDAGIKAITDYYESRGIKADVKAAGYPGFYSTDFILENNPLVSIIIPNKDHTDDLDRCVTSILQKSDYTNYEIIIVENNSTDEKTFEFYERLKKRDNRIQILTWTREFNFAAINNFAAKNANGEYLLLLNNDTELISPNLLTSMCGYLQREEVGMVGAKLLYPNNRIQHAGLLIGVHGGAHHVFLSRPDNTPGYFLRAVATQDMSGVTAACMLIKRDVYEMVGGMDEDFAVAYNDVDLCLKVEQAGYLCIYDAFVKMYHYESQSRGYEQTDEQQERFNKETSLLQNKWGERLQRDPYYNDNLALNHGYYNLP